MAKIGATPLVKCVIQNTEGAENFTALFNPKELSWDKTAGWQQHNPDKGDPQDGLMEFTNAKPRSMSVEFFLDTYELKAPVNALIKPLEKMMEVDKVEKRPPIVLLIWGDVQFKGVIESLSVKYTMFLPTGIPVRATATIKMTEAKTAKKAAKK